MELIEIIKKNLVITVMVSFVSTTIEAQLCTASLGDPIVNINFGSGTGRGAALGSSVTAYTYSSSGQLDEGVYTIANTTSGLKGNAWHIISDHTGNTNGYMMVVNSARLSSEGVFYTKTVSGLCAGTTYEFSAWLINIMNPASGTDQYHPNVTFRVSTTDGTVLGSYTTGEIPQTSSPNWKQYGFYFNSGIETEVVITMLNSAPSAVPGNDIALDDITFRPCGASLSISLSEGSTSKDICEGTTLSLSFVGTVSNGYTNPSFQWQLSTDEGVNWIDISGAVTTVYSTSISLPGVYRYRMSVADGANIASVTCRIVSNEITATIHATPVVGATSNAPSCYYETLKLSASANQSGGSYLWSGPGGFSSTSQNPVINSVVSDNVGLYTVVFTSDAGCVNQATTPVSAESTPTAQAGDDITVCAGNTVTLQGSGSGSIFSWSPDEALSSPGSSATSATPADTTIYVLTVSNGTCINKDSVTVFVLPLPTADAGVDTYMIEGTSVQLTGISGGGQVSYYWTPSLDISSANSLTPVVWPAENAIYTLHVVSEYGCGTATDEVNVFVYKKLIIPNAFSPNGDGINDTWTISHINAYGNADVSVFNRYGQLVFHSTGYPNDWDGKLNGKPLPVGTYYYVIDLKTNIPLRYSGWVALLR